MPLQQSIRVGDGPAQFELDGAEALQEFEVGAHHLLVQPEIRDEIHHPAQPLLLVINRDLVPLLGQNGRRTEPRRSRSNDADHLPILLGLLEFRHPDFVGHFDDRGLNGGNVDRCIERPSRASLHAEIVRTDHPAHPAERVRTHDQRRRPPIVRFLAHSRGHDEVRRRAIGRASLLTGFFFAILAPAQFRAELGVGKTSVTSFHRAAASIHPIPHVGAGSENITSNCETKPHSSLTGSPARKRVLIDRYDP